MGITNDYKKRSRNKNLTKKELLISDMKVFRQTYVGIVYLNINKDT